MSERVARRCDDTVDKKRVNSYVLKHLFLEGVEQSKANINQLIVQAWVNEILTLPEKTIDTARQSRSTMNSTISQLHKRASTNQTSDQRPVVLVNSGCQLHNYIKAAEEDRETDNCLRTRTGQGQAGPKCQHQHAKNAFRHA